jgi:hypothetical protein
MFYILALPKWMGWIPILVLAILVPFSFWVRWQIRKINHEEGPVGLERQVPDTDAKQSRT